MAAGEPSIGVPSSSKGNKTIPLPVSFVEAIKGTTHKMSSSEAAHSSHSVVAPIDPNCVEFLPISEIQGKPAILFPIDRKAALVDKLKYVLVGKFSHGRPLWSKIKLFFQNLKLQGEFNVSISDYKHIFIECSCKADFDKLWMKLFWSIDGFIMRVFKWGPDFTPLKESSIVPTWIRMVGLPLHLFDEMTLLQISNIFGKPIKIDPRNANKSMRNQARVCVQLDVAKPLLDSCWVGFSDVTGKIIESYHVKVYYDSLSFYCSSCAHLGHRIEMCKRLVTKEACNVENSKQDSDTSKEEKTTIVAGKGQQKLGKEHTQNGKSVVVVHNRIESEAEITVKRPGKETWQPVVRQKKIDALASISNVQNTGLISVVSSHELDNSGFQVVEGRVKKFVADSVSKQTTTQNQFDAISPACNNLGDKDGEQFEVEGETLHEVGSHSDVVSTDVNAYECCETIITQLEMRKNDAASKAIVIVAEPLLTDGIEDCNKTKGAILNRVEATKFQQTSMKPTAVSEEAYLQHNRPELNSEFIPFSPPTELIEKGQSFKIVTDCDADVDYKNNKTIGVVTRSQMKASNYTWANHVEEEQTAEQHTPIASKKKEEYKATQSSKTRRKEIIKLSNRINKIASRLKDKNLRDETKRQLQADLEALKDEHYQLC